MWPGLDRPLRMPLLPPPPPPAPRPTLVDLRQAYQTLEMLMNDTMVTQQIFPYLREVLRELAVQIVQRGR